MAEHPALRSTRIDILMLDTTYALEKHVFPPQDQASQALVHLARFGQCAELSLHRCWRRGEGKESYSMASTHGPCARIHRRYCRSSA